jgi:hypothetical protein
MLFRTLPVAYGCNKVPEKEKTSGNRYKRKVGKRPAAKMVSERNSTDLRFGRSVAYLTDHSLSERALV